MAIWLIKLSNIVWLNRKREDKILNSKLFLPDNYELLEEIVLHLGQGSHKSL